MVEIDESKFGKRKFHKGRRVGGVWVYRGMEKETKRCFFTTVAYRPRYNKSKYPTRNDSFMYL